MSNKVLEQLCFRYHKIVFRRTIQKKNGDPNQKFQKPKCLNSFSFSNRVKIVKYSWKTIA